MSLLLEEEHLHTELYVLISTAFWAETFSYENLSFIEFCKIQQLSALG
jgi:hypothetical protein